MKTELSMSVYAETQETRGEGSHVPPGAAGRGLREAFQAWEQNWGEDTEVWRGETRRLNGMRASSLLVCFAFYFVLRSIVQSAWTLDN